MYIDFKSLPRLSKVLNIGSDKHTTIIGDTNSYKSSFVYSHYIMSVLEQTSLYDNKSSHKVLLFTNKYKVEIAYLKIAILYIYDTKRLIINIEDVLRGNISEEYKTLIEDVIVKLKDIITITRAYNNIPITTVDTIIKTELETLDKECLLLVIFDSIDTIFNDSGAFINPVIVKYINNYLQYIDNYNVHFVSILHVNRKLWDISRNKMIEMIPNIYNVRDGYMPIIDYSDTVICLFNPQNFPVCTHNSELLGYDNTQISSFFIMTVLKNKYNKSNFKVGMYSLNTIGLIKELPKEQEVTKQIYNKIKDEIQSTSLIVKQ